MFLPNDLVIYEIYAFATNNLKSIDKGEKFLKNYKTNHIIKTTYKRVQISNS